MSVNNTFYRMLFFAFFLLTSNTVFAEWIEVGHSDERSFQMYYDPATINKKGDIATVKVLKNFKAPRNSVDPNRPYTFLSNIATQEIWCSENKERLLHIDIWSGTNGTGKIEQSHDYAGRKDWGRRFKISSIESAVISKACSSTKT
jgi:hypothetical protein